MLEYIRTTHNFDNETREWECRWKLSDTRLNSSTLSKYSLGVHALSRDRWMSMREIIDETIDALSRDAGGNMREFIQFIKDTPNHREIIKKDILVDFENLIKLDLIRARTVHKGSKEADEYWSS